LPPSPFMRTHHGAALVGTFLNSIRSCIQTSRPYRQTPASLLSERLRRAPVREESSFEPDRKLRVSSRFAKAWLGMRTFRFPAPQAPCRAKRFSVAGASLLETKISLEVQRRSTRVRPPSPPKKESPAQRCILGFQAVSTDRPLARFDRVALAGRRPGSV